MVKEKDFKRPGDIFVGINCYKSELHPVCPQFIGREHIMVKHICFKNAPRHFC